MNALTLFCRNVWYRVRERLSRPSAPVYVLTDDYTCYRYRSDGM